MKKIMALLLVVTTLTSCFRNFYRVKSSGKIAQSQWLDLTNTDRYVIIHFKDNEKLLINPVAQDSSVSGELANTPYLKTKYLHPTSKSRNPYKFRERELLFSQVHLYLNDSLRNRSAITINKHNFYKMELYARNSGASIRGHVLSSLLVLMAVAAVAIPILTPKPPPPPAPTDCNCPQVYLETRPQHYEFKGGMYSGAIMKNLERTDIYPFTAFNPQGDTINIKIKSLPGETQFINHVAIKKVLHPIGSTVVATPEGNLFAAKNTSAPDRIWVDHEAEQPSILAKKDGINYAFKRADSNSPEAALTLEFKVPEHQKSALLILHGANTTWSGFIYQYFKSLYGNQYASWVSSKEKTNSTPMNNWLIQQGLVLKASVWNGKSWDYVNYFPMVGNTASRDMALEIRIPENYSGKLRIKLATAFHFWEIDKAGLSLNFLKLAQTESLTAVYAAVNGRDSLPATKLADDQYAVLEPTDEIHFGFRKTTAIVSRDTAITYILYMKGYYHQQSYSGKPMQPENLLSLSKPGSLHALSNTTYRNFGFRE